MTEQTTVIHPRIPDDLYAFIGDMAQTIEYHNKAHVVIVALKKLKEYEDTKGCYPPTIDSSYRDRIEYNKQ